ncbi:hypothetical protein [Methylocucumis oryzae]|uniref:hypothetical protein n=1 Tax=Methylocucumis oryzae TaxID=1632867 RepID=UPI0006976FDC|nr:hypothetical protein [Methylocucumis oryzae]
MMNLNTNLDMDFKTFLRWWRRELCLLVPKPIKRLISDNQGVIVIHSTPAGLAIRYFSMMFC